jgi:hypothetical protein
MSDRQRRGTSPMTAPIRLRRAVVTAAAAIAVLAIAGVGSASAKDPGFLALKATPSNSQAGGHPNVRLLVSFVRDYDAGSGLECEARHDCLAPRTFSIHWPTGFIGNPHVAPQCTATEFNQGSCPVDSQVGKVEITGEEGGVQLGLFVPLYNLETRPDQAGLLGFIAPIFGVPILLELTGRTNSDYGLEAVSSPQVRIPFDTFTTTLWGVPHNPEHDFERFFTPLTGLAGCLQGIFTGVKGCPPGGPICCGDSPTFAPAGAPEAPFLQNPTTCGVPLTMAADIEYYDGRSGHAESPWPETTGCSQASFNPALTAKATTSQADTASGLDTDLRVPQTQSPRTPSPSELRTAILTLPKDFSINPGASDGKVACADDQTAIGTLFAATCPEFSKIGTLSVDVSALPAPIPGALYLAEPKPGNPYRVLIAADGFATHVKLLGSVRPDPVTGQLKIMFVDLPQAPLQEFDIHIFGSERGLLATPTHCGTYTVESEFVPWNSELNTRFSTSFITIDAGPGGAPCPHGPRPFGPRLAAGTNNSTAGMHAPFSLTISRDDGDQNMSALTVETPPGFSATLKGIPYCPQQSLDRFAEPGYSGLAEQASPACPVESRIGTVVSGAGAGSHPLFITGTAYLAGPYKGAPFSMVAVIPAVSGPYDLGVVAVRTAIEVDPTSARVRTVSDQLPQIIEGIPLRLRSIMVDLDRPHFALNPTNCDPLSVDATIRGDEGATAHPDRRFQVANCAKLPYAPQVSLTMMGGVRRRGHPAIRGMLKTTPGDANLRSISVTLPRGQLLDNAHIGTICTRADFSKQACPAASIYGRAEVVTPLLDRPLKGNVYLRASSNKLPDMVLDLEGQLDFEAVARIDSVRGRLRTNFESIPDVPVSMVVLNLAGGSKGLVVNSESLCGEPRRAVVKTRGQNGAIFDTKAKVNVSCGSRARHKRPFRNGKEGR